MIYLVTMNMGNYNSLEENKEAQNYLRHQEALIYQRLNYFLVGNAFIMTAFATLVVGYFTKNCHLGVFVYLIALLGIIVSSCFLYSTRVNSEHLKKLYSFVENIEKNTNVNENTQVYSFLIKKFLRKPNSNNIKEKRKIISEIIEFTKSLLKNPDGVNNDDVKKIREHLDLLVINSYKDNHQNDVIRNPARLTWGVPSIFIGFWFVIGALFYLISHDFGYDIFKYLY